MIVFDWLLYLFCHRVEAPCMVDRVDARVKGSLSDFHHPIVVAYKKSKDTFLLIGAGSVQSAIRLVC
jgi:hypothetical protein